MIGQTRQLGPPEPVVREKNGQSKCVVLRPERSLWIQSGKSTNSKRSNERKRSNTPPKGNQARRMRPSSVRDQ